MKRGAWLVTLGILALLVLFVAFYTNAGQQLTTNAPRQPIAFFHYVHAGNKQIACEYCHRTTRTAAFAGMPSTEFCMRCHRVVIPQFPEIQKLHGYWNRREAVPWVRVNRLPGFVTFTHQAHTVTGKLDCAECHGQVAQMAQVRQTAPLRMGWCLKCHRRLKAPTDCWTCHR